MKKNLFLFSLFVGLAWTNFISAQDAPAKPALTRDEYNNTITRRLVQHLKLSAAQEVHVHDVLMKYGEVPSGGDMSVLSPDCEREIMETLQPEQTVNFKKNRDMILTTEAPAQPAGKNKSPAKKTKK